MSFFGIIIGECVLSGHGDAGKGFMVKVSWSNGYNVWLSVPKCRARKIPEIAG